MLQNEKELRSLVYEIQQNGRVDDSTVDRIIGYLVSIDKKIKDADNLYRLVEKVDFSKFYRCEEIKINQEKIEHLVELKGVSLHFSDRETYDFLNITFFESFISNLATATNIFLSLLNIFFGFSRETRYAPNIGEIINILKSEFPDHELTRLLLEEYSTDPKTWMYTLRSLKNTLHHESAYIGEFEVTDLSKRKISFFIYEKYFNSSVLMEEREIRYFCKDVLGKTGQFLSGMYEIISRELEVKNRIPLYGSTRA